MNVTFRPVGLTRVAIVAWACLIASGDALADPPATASTRQRQHPRISQAPLEREYRPLPAHASAASVAADEGIRAALERTVQRDAWRFAEVPLRDAVLQIRDALAIPMDVDTRALSDAGIDLEMPITFQSPGGTARAMLERMLDAVDLTWVVRDECLLVTTRDAANESLTVRLYPLPFGHDSDSTDVDVQSLVDMIHNTVHPQGWGTVGGQGTITPLNDLRVLAVSQTEAAHHELEGLMTSLHARALAEYGLPADGSDPPVPLVRIHRVAGEKARADLAGALVGLCNESLAKGADPQARVTVVGECLAVRSASPEFHILAGRLIRAVDGVDADVDVPAAAAVQAPAEGGANQPRQ